MDVMITITPSNKDSTSTNNTFICSYTTKNSGIVTIKPYFSNLSSTKVYLNPNIVYSFSVTPTPKP